MITREYLVPNGDGWLLSLTQSWEPERLVPGRRPVLIVPGYGMNSFIFSYHPHGPSLEGSLAAAGFEVWRADLRGQGPSQRDGGSDDFGLADLALTDLPAAIAAALQRSRTGADRADVIGASLGGTLLYAHVALCPDHRVGSMVAMGSPVRWVKVHPAVRLAAASPFLVGLLPFRGTRQVIEHLAPILARRVPWLLSAYINPSISDLGAIREMVRTVEDPSRHVNREIARWIRRRDLWLRGRDVAAALPAVRTPLLCVLASHDGIVPRETALFPLRAVSSPRKDVLEVGDRDLAVAHADLFVSSASHDGVFRPVAEWLAAQGPHTAI